MGLPQHNSDTDRLFPCQDELLTLFETLINVIFCVKSIDGQYVRVNSAFVRRTGRKSMRDVIGTSATDHFVTELAERYEEQDRHVFETGEPLRDQLELIRRTNGELGWYLTTKLPVGDRQDPSHVVGLVSVSRDLLTPSDENLVLERLQHVVKHVRDHIAEGLKVTDLAEIAKCSESQLERRMRKVFGMSVRQHILRVRVETATRLLTETDETLATIAALSGYYDQADFTRQFARLTNATPAQFRVAQRAG